MDTIDRYLLTFLLNSLWQVPLAAVAAALICRGMRNGPAQHRHLVWVAALVAAVLLPAASTRRWTPDPPTVAVPHRGLVEARAVAAAIEANAPEPVRQPAPRVVPVARNIAGTVFAAYLLFLGLRLAWLARAAMRTVRVRTRARPSGAADIDRVCARCAAAFGVRVDVRISATLPGPVSAGSTIILPENLLVETSEDMLTTAIGHEMAHVARRDFWLNLFYELLSTPVAFHPAVLWMRREIARTREMACDEMVAGRLLAPRVYAESLVNIARRITAQRAPGYALGVFDAEILEARVRRVIEGRRGSLKRARLMLAAGLGSLAVCAAIASGLAISARAQSVAQPDMKRAVDAFNRGDFHLAVEYFERAVSLDPNYINARLHLAHALMRNYAGNAPKNPNENAPAPLLERARQQFAEVLAREPNNMAAIFGIVALNGPFRARESRELMLKAIVLNPKNTEAYYSVGVLDWQMVYKAIVNAKAAQQDVQVADPAAARRLREEWTPYIEEGLRMLQIALAQDHGHSEAMAFMNLLLRAKAAVAGTSAEADRLIAQANEWVKRSLISRRAAPKTVDLPIREDEPPPLLVQAGPPPPPPPPSGGRKNAGPPPPPPPPKA